MGRSTNVSYEVWLKTVRKFARSLLWMASPISYSTRVYSCDRNRAMMVGQLTCQLSYFAFSKSTDILEVKRDFGSPKTLNVHWASRKLLQPTVSSIRICLWKLIGSKCQLLKQRCKDSNIIFFMSNMIQLTCLSDRTIWLSYSEWLTATIGTIWQKDEVSQVGLTNADYCSTASRKEKTRKNFQDTIWVQTYTLLSKLDITQEHKGAHFILSITYTWAFSGYKQRILSIQVNFWVGHMS